MNLFSHAEAQKSHIILPVIVEGRYDRIKLESLFDVYVLTTEGFGIFRKGEKLALIRRLAAQYGKIIVLTDSDGAGNVIRNFFNSALPKEQLIHLYTPQLPGKEKRKTAPSKAGFLGVEGMEADLLRKLFAPYCGEALPAPAKPLSKTDFYLDGYVGKPDSVARRAALATAASLPHDMTANALLAAINLLYGEEGYRALHATLPATEKESLS